MASASTAQTNNRRPRYDRDIHYELNLRPGRTAAQEAAAPAFRPQQAPKAPLWDKLHVYALILLGGVLGVAGVLSSSWANELQKEINQTLGATKAAYEEIDALAIKINRSLDINAIERRATEELGMVYPAPERLVYIGDVAEIADFSQYIKEGAYDPFGGGLEPLRLVMSTGGAE